MKAQVELLAVFGVILVAVVVMLFFFLGGTYTTQKTKVEEISEISKLVRKTVNDVLKSSIKNALLKIYDQGGYYNVEGVENVDFGMLKVAVWQKCGSYAIPDLKEELISGIEGEIREGISEVMSYFGKNVVFKLDELDVEVNVLEDRVRVEVHLPVKVEGSDIPSNYIIERDANLKEITEFSTDFAKEQNETRFFERVTMVSMMFSNPYSKDWLPVWGSNKVCGNVLVKYEDELKSSLKKLARYVPSHVVWNRKTKPNKHNPFFPINKVGDEAYALDVTFSYPEGWDLEKHSAVSPRTFKSVPKPIKIKAGPISLPLPLICMDFYSELYTFRYPVVVSVRDEKLNHWFNFAIMVAIKNNEPDMSCGNITIAENALCKKANHKVKFRVVNESSEPVKSAYATFYSCEVGKSDENGYVEGYVPAISSQLLISKEGYKSEGTFKSYGEINNSVFTLKKLRNVTFHFLAVPLLAVDSDYDYIREHEGPGVHEGYLILTPPVPPSFIKDSSLGGTSDEPALLTTATLFPKDYDIFSQENPEAIISNLQNGELMDDVATFGFVYGDYDARATSMNFHNSESPIILGCLPNKTVSLSGSEVCVYVPVLMWIYDNAQGIRKVEDSINLSECSKMEALLGSVGISEPITTNCNLGRFGDNAWKVVQYCQGSGYEGCGCNELDDDWDPYKNAESVLYDGRVVPANDSKDFVFNLPSSDRERAYKLETWVSVTTERTITFNMSSDDGAHLFVLDPDDNVIYGNGGELWCSRGKDGNNCGAASCPSNQECCDKSITLKPGWYHLVLYVYNKANTPGDVRLIPKSPEVEHFSDLFDVMSSVKPPFL